MLGSSDVASVAKIVAGSANHPLQSEQSAALLAERGILYAPDFAINAGDLVALSLGRAPATRARIEAEVVRIGATLERVYHRAREARVLPSAAAAALAGERIRTLHEAVPAAGRREL